VTPETRTQRIGLFGGSFDPPHIGHVALVQAALDVLQLDAVWVIPAGLPVHRTLSGHATPEQRLGWMQKIFSDNERVKVLDWEVAGSAPTPTIITLRRFVADLPQQRPVWLLGADAFAGMDGWVEYPEHGTLCDVAVFGRVACSAGSSVSAFRPQSLADWLDSPVAGGHRVDVDVPLPDMSATAIRRAAERNESLAGMVPECVRRDIEQTYVQSRVCRSECG